MLCDSIRVWFNDYLDGDLDSKNKEAVDNHLEQCSDCRQEFNKLKQVDDCLRLEVRRMFKEIPLPDGLQAKIDDKIKKRGSRLPFYRRLHGSYSGIAAALFILAAAYGMFYQQFGGHLFNKVTDRESLSGVVEQANLPEVKNPDQEYQDTDTDVDVGVNGIVNSSSVTLYDRAQTDTTGGSAGRDSLYMRNQPANSQEPKVMVELPAPAGPMAAEVTTMKSIRIGNVTDSNAAGTGAGKQIDNSGSKNKAIVPLMPSYLPEGTVLDSLSNSEDMVYINYTSGSSVFEIEERLEPEANVLGDKLSKGKEVNINGQNGTLSESAATGRVTITFRRNSLLITIEGTLPVEEILKIAESLK